MKKIYAILILCGIISTAAIGQTNKNNWTVSQNITTTLDLNENLEDGFKFSKDDLLKFSYEISNNEIINSDIIIVNKENSRFIRGFKQGQTKNINQEINLTMVWDKLNQKYKSTDNLFEIQFIYITTSGEKHIEKILDFKFQ